MKIRVSDRPIALFPWEQKEYERHYEEMHLQKRMANFMRDSIRSLAKKANEEAEPMHGAVIATLLLDIIEDSDSLRPKANR